MYYVFFFFVEQNVLNKIPYTLYYMIFLIFRFWFTN